MDPISLLIHVFTKPSVWFAILYWTRMHSSGMRTARFICRLGGRVVSACGGVCPGGGSVCPGDVHPLSHCMLGCTASPPLPVSRMTAGVWTLPCPELRLRVVNVTPTDVNDGNLADHQKEINDLHLWFYFLNFKWDEIVLETMTKRWFFPILLSQALYIFIVMYRFLFQDQLNGINSILFFKVSPGAIDMHLFIFVDSFQFLGTVCGFCLLCHLMKTLVVWCQIHIKSKFEVTVLEDRRWPNSQT